MKRTGLLALLSAALACGSNPSLIPAGDFSGPSGLAMAPLPDRDLLFVANQGSNELRAVTFCNAPPGATTTCSSNEDGRFLPAPVRVFAGSIGAGERPLRLAAARILDAQSLPHGAVLVIGSDRTLRVIDAANILAASQDKNVHAAPPKLLQLPGVPIDVVTTSADVASPTAIVATQAPPGELARLIVLTVSLGPDGIVVAQTQQCTVDFVPTRLALIPGAFDLQGRPSFVYVADGTPAGTPGGIGDGAVEVSVPDIPAASGPLSACPVTRRLPASDPAESPRQARPLIALALSPRYHDATGSPVPEGTFLVGVTGPDPALCAMHVQTCPAELNVPPGAVCVDHGQPGCGRGRLVLLNPNIGGQSQVLRVPPPGDPARPNAPMVPLRPKTPAVDVAFLGLGNCSTQITVPDCTALRLFTSGNSSTPVTPNPGLIGAVTSEDGSVNFLDVLNRRFFNDLRDVPGGAPLPLDAPVVIRPTLSEQFLPNLELAPPVPFAAGAPDTISKQITGWVNPGVTRTAAWFVVWHGVMPGLESISGTFQPRTAGSPTVSFRLVGGKSLAPWTSAPELQLGSPPACTLPYPQCVGDFVRILSYSRTDACAAFAAAPTTVDVPIAAVDADGLGLQLQAVAGFDPGPECFTSAPGATVEVHFGTTAAGAWMVFEGPRSSLYQSELDALGRVPHGSQFVVTGPRFDYPAPAPFPVLALPSERDLVLSFTMTGPEPPTPGTFFRVETVDNQAITSYRDLSGAGQPGFAGPLLVYSSARRPEHVIFTTLTGSNSLMALTPALLGVTSPNPSFLY